MTIRMTLPEIAAACVSKRLCPAGRQSAWIEGKERQGIPISGRRLSRLELMAARLRGIEAEMAAIPDPEPPLPPDRATPADLAAIRRRNGLCRIMGRTGPDGGDAA